MVEHGADIKSQLRFGASKTDFAIAQLLQYNCYARYKEGASTHRHSKDRETPFPVYMGISVYAKTRKRKLIELLHGHGISISYDRVLEISAQLGEATVSKYVEDGVVCPPVLRRGLFTTAAMDNLDHNPTVTTATISFHGTSISVFQHPIKDYKGEERGQLKFGEDKVKVIPELPDSFTNIRPAFFTKKYPVPPKSNVTENIVTGPDNSLHMSQLALEYEWLEKVTVTDGPVDVTWSAHHASKKRHPTFEVGITSLLPLLRDQAHSVATVRHVMDKIKDIVAFLNPGQERLF
ncbi:Nicotinate phosphoribosyltransferase [Dissostichus eleginoides]|uniref:Nicotinate phosphoribosyltransferase n=1 Tax=Dissostichus eleginoides TaxID=100907 RepID=A0AAD9CQQ7_DISEL|nr:Nicotinate phosphoribosyltransferase [Dissostichus eleginoides]